MATFFATHKNFQLPGDYTEFFCIQRLIASSLIDQLITKRSTVQHPQLLGIYCHEKVIVQVIQWETVARQSQCNLDRLSLSDCSPKSTNSCHLIYEHRLPTFYNQSESYLNLIFRPGIDAAQTAFLYKRFPMICVILELKTLPYSVTS